MNGISNANTECQKNANSYLVPGKFKAWLSTSPFSVVNAKDNIQPTVPTRKYRRVDGTIIADNFADLLSGSLNAALNKTASGATYNNPIYTGTKTDGTPAIANCLSWADTIGNGRVGRSNFSTNQWTDSSDNACTNSYRIYCFQYD